jgi:3-phenylpropionate/trans-cinnamate dioxygenase ferredoxin reductase subunit
VSSRVVIVGAGHAGTTLAALLRQDGHRGEIIMFGDEVDLPYHRPPLSKRFADGDAERWLRPAPFYAEQRIDLRLGERVASIDRAGRRVHAGAPCQYDVLVLATGARQRQLRARCIRRR